MREAEEGDERAYTEFAVGKTEKMADEQLIWERREGPDFDQHEFESGFGREENLTSNCCLSLFLDRKEGGRRSGTRPRPPPWRCSF